MNIRDIAKMAGVSAATVSKVMNGKDNDISDKTREKILSIIDEVHYVPYLKYLEKEGLKNKILGLIVRKDNPERESIVFNTEKAIKEFGYSLLVCYEDESNIFRQVDELEKKKVCGIIIDSMQNDVYTKMKTPCIFIGDLKGEENLLRSSYFYRLQDAGKLAANKLLEVGHQKIACIVNQKDREIVKGYRQAMQERNFPIRPNWICDNFSLDEIKKNEINQCIDKNVTAIICGNQEIACCVWEIMERTRIIIPDNLSIIVIGNGKLLEVLGYGISSIQLPIDEICQEAVNTLVESIRTNSKKEVVKCFAPKLLERNSITCPRIEKNNEKIIVVGSMNIDIMIEASQLPMKGETQIAEKLLILPGGKGANQAIGAGKLGGQVYMVGCLGNDIDGKNIYFSLMESYVHTDGVVFDKSLPTGKAYINIDESGESSIIIYSGANQNLSIKQINRCQYLFQDARFCLLSTEIPEEIVAHTIWMCKKNQVDVILKPSSIRMIDEKLLQDIGYIVPNENELNFLVSEGKGVEEKAAILKKKGVKNVIVTLGSEGCYLLNDELSLYFHGARFKAVDTTGGADSFISALAVYLSEGRRLTEAIGFAIYASGITVTRYGVQPALPDREVVDVYEEEIHMEYGV